MLAEAGVADRTGASSERPLKRRRPGEKRGQGDAQESTSKGKSVVVIDDDESDEEDIDFQDVPLPLPTVQTLEKDSDEDSDDEDEQAFEDVDFAAALNTSPSAPSESKDMELNLTAQKAATTPTKKGAERRKPLSKEERDRRAEVHKMHLLCLLSHAARRNHWCNEAHVQEILRQHVSESTANYLTPGSHLSQFGQTESLKTGLKQAADMWRAKFEITERGLKKSRWAEDLEHLQQVGWWRTLAFYAL